VNGIEISDASIASDHGWPDHILCYSLLLPLLITHRVKREAESTWKHPSHDDDVTWCKKLTSECELYFIYNYKPLRSVQLLHWTTKHTFILYATDLLQSVYIATPPNYKVVSSLLSCSSSTRGS